MEHRGDIFQSIINSAPVPVIWMSESVNEVDGMRRSDRRRRRRRTDWVEVEEGWMERGEDTAKWKRKRRKEEEKGIMQGRRKKSVMTPL